MTCTMEAPQVLMSACMILAELPTPCICTVDKGFSHPVTYQLLTWVPLHLFRSACTSFTTGLLAASAVNQRPS